MLPHISTTCHQKLWVASPTALGTHGRITTSCSAASERPRLGCASHRRESEASENHTHSYKKAGTGSPGASLIFCILDYQAQLKSHASSHTTTQQLLCCQRCDASYSEFCTCTAQRTTWSHDLVQQVRLLLSSITRYACSIAS